MILPLFLFVTLTQTKASHLIQWTDPNGTVCDMAQDGLGRLLSRNVTRGTGVIGSTLEVFGYDGLSRTTLWRNNDGVNPGNIDVVMAYDSLSNTTKDQQGSLEVDSSFDGVSNRTSCTYPNARVLTSTFDNGNRLHDISDTGGTIATLHYKGPVRMERRTYGNDGSPISRTDYGYDALPRVDDIHHSNGGLIAEFEYGYDRMSHRLFEKRVHESNTGEVFGYDSVYRLRTDLQNVNLSAVSPGQEILPESFTSPDSQAYALDGVGNRTTSTKTVSGTPTTSTYTEGANDAKVNQYTSVSGGLSLTLTHDLNGNVTSDGAKKYAYDFKNRPVEVRDQNTNALIARYTYDAGDRRGMVEAFPGPVVTHRLFDGSQVVEERDGSNAVTRQYVWGSGVDDLLQETTPSATYYAHEDARGDICALSDGTGAVVERYRYDPFGGRTITLNGSTGNEYGFQSCRHEAGSGLVHMRAREMNTDLGQFMQRDPVGVWVDELGNAYAFVGNDPWDGRDPRGRETITLGGLAIAFAADPEPVSKIGLGVAVGVTAVVVAGVATYEYCKHRNEEKARKEEAREQEEAQREEEARQEEAREKEEAENEKEFQKKEQERQKAEEEGTKNTQRIQDKARPPQVEGQQKEEIDPAQSRDPRKIERIGKSDQGDRIEINKAGQEALEEGPKE